jgi:hypothetical protein
MQYCAEQATLLGENLLHITPASTDVFVPLLHPYITLRIMTAVVKAWGYFCAIVALSLVGCLQESAPFMRVLGSYPMELQLGGLDSNTPFDSINES